MTYIGDYSYSFLIPCNNPTIELLSTILSIRAQLDIEIIVVLDYVLKDNIYLPALSCISNLKIVHNSRSPGISGALNSGIMNCTSDYIIRIDSGDILLSGYQYTLVAHGQSNPADLTVFSILVSDRTKVYSMSPRTFYLKNILTPFSRLPHPTWIIRRSSILYLYRESPIAKRCEDYIFLLDNSFDINISRTAAIFYDTEKSLSLISEIRSGFWKSLVFLLKSKSLPSILIASAYLLVRILRLVFSTRKLPLSQVFLK